MYNNFAMYPANYNVQAQAQRLQKMRDDITDQLAQLQQQPMAPQIQQTFITPQVSSPADIPARWVDNYEDVKLATTYVATIFMDRNKSRFYIKDEQGGIKSYDFVEVEELDEKDLKIRELENRIRDLETGGMNGKSVDEPTSRESTNTTSANEPATESEP